MEQVIKFLPLILSLMSQGGEVRKIIGLLVEAFSRVQTLLPQSGPDVSKMVGIQEALKKLGYDPGPIDGQLGDKTKAAVRAFQAAHPPLVADDWPGGQTQAALAVALGGGV